MQPKYHHGNVQARCPDCGGAVTTFEHTDGHKEFGHISSGKQHAFKGQMYGNATYRLLRCAGCGRGGLAKFLGGNHDIIAEFYPASVQSLPIPANVPTGIQSEFKEAERCYSIGAWRGASALLRSVLEKTLKSNGYIKGTLEKKIDEAAKDGVLTSARKQRAHEDIRVLGNEVVHDEWREVTQEEVDLAHHYAQRILEDFYDDRTTVEALLTANKRLPLATNP